MKILLSISFYLFSFLANSQSNNNLIPFYENGKWGYCDESLNRVVEPRFSEAFPFYKGVAVVMYTQQDTNWLDEYFAQNEDGSVYTQKNYSIYENERISIIDANGKDIITPFIGEVEFGENNIVCRTGHLSWNQSQQFDEEGNQISEIVTYSLEIDSSIVYDLKGKIFLPKIFGRYYLVNNNCIEAFYHKISEIGNENEVDGDKDKVCYLNSGNQIKVKNDVQVECFNNNIYLKTDTTIAMVDEKGKQKWIYHIPNEERNFRIVVINENKIFCFNNDFLYKLKNNKGIIIKEGSLKCNSVMELNKLISFFNREKFPNTIMRYIIFKDCKLHSVTIENNIILSKWNSEVEKEEFYYYRPNDSTWYGPYELMEQINNEKSIAQTKNEIVIISSSGKTEQRLMNCTYSDFTSFNHIFLIPEYFEFFKVITQEPGEKKYYFDARSGKKYLII